MKQLGLTLVLLLIVLINMGRLITCTNTIQPLIAYPTQGECANQDWYCTTGIMVFNPDTLELQHLELGSIEVTAIRWSPDYKSLLYLRGNATGWTFNRVFLTGEQDEGILDVGWGGWANWSSNGQNLAVNIYPSAQSENTFGLHIMSSDFSQDWRLTDDITILGYPVWRPDGRELLITASLKNYGYDVTGIWRVDAQNGSRQNITDDFTSSERFNDYAPAYSSDGQYVAFVSERTGRPEVFIMNADGSDVRQLTFHGVDYYSNPEWMLNDTAIVYWDWDEDRIFFALIDLETLAISEIDLESHLSGYDLSPDRTQIVFIQNADLDHPRLCIISLITHETQCLDVPSPDFSGVPVWDYR